MIHRFRLGVLALLVLGAGCGAATSEVSRMAPISNPLATPLRPAWMASEPTSRICDVQVVPIAFSFRCLDSVYRSTIYGPLNDPAMRSLVQLILDRPDLEGVILDGYQANTGPERELPLTLSQRRAESVARELVRRGYPPERIDVLAAGFHGDYPEREACTPTADGQSPLVGRAVTVRVILCSDPRRYEWRAFGRLP